ncbi:hypothetical protein [Hallella colorans]|uniref:hypothetical protein n=1 Tax=Hallella colorans TaxID=1703337 RepID=UPI0023F3FC1C|nr:hypothetical protein [Hallella colorans]
MKKLSILSIAIIASLTIISCNSKKTNSAKGVDTVQSSADQSSTEPDAQSAGIAGIYTSTGDFEGWHCVLDEDGTGMESAVYSNGDEEIDIPFNWKISDGKIIFTFDTDGASVTNQDAKYEEIVNAAMQGYSEPRECNIKVEGKNVTIDGEGIYPTYELNVLGDE